MSIKPSIYSKIELLASDGRTADIRLAVASVDYYEDLLVPSYSVKIQIANAGGSIVDEDNKAVTLYDGMKIRGGETVYMLIRSNSQTNEDINFLTRPLYVRSIKNLIRDGLKEFFQLNLVPREAVENQLISLKKMYPKDTPISDHVSTILNESFTTQPPTIIDRTYNKLGFLGNDMSPFDAIVKLASKSVPGISGSSSAGYFFYQTRDGFNFRSVDNLINQDPVDTFFYTEVNRSSVDFKPSGDFRSLDQKIISYSVIENQDLIRALRKGTYATGRRFFDPITFEVTSPRNSFTGKDYRKNIPNLGKKINEKEVGLSDSSFSFLDTPSKTLVEVRDYGTVESGVSQENTATIEQYLSQRRMRYNTLFTQRLRIKIPLNTRLRAGSIIRCNFPKITNDNSDTYDRGQITGLYMVSKLCHHFDAVGSYTAMEVVRDTFGRTQSN